VLSLRTLAPLRLELTVRCQHGTYVKEWISGDERRTTPSLSDLLGVGCRCELLDVAEILTDEAPAAAAGTSDAADPRLRAGGP
jgi:tRNA U54 and U55 pseudouridine synthase Pus10